MELRDYQSTAIESARDAFRRSRSVCLVAPTGSGKTIMGCDVVRRTLEAKARLAGALALPPHRTQGPRLRSPWRRL